MRKSTDGTQVSLNMMIYYKSIILGYPGGLRERTAKRAFWKRPEDVLWRSVGGMLPKNRLLEARLKKLLIFPGPTHTLTDVEVFKWEMPAKVTKRLSDKGRLAPPPKGTFKKTNN